MSNEKTRRKVRFHLKTLIARYEDSTGERLPYRTLSERTGVSTNTLSRMANNQLAMLHLDVAERLVAFFGCELEDLVRLEPTYEAE